MQRDKIYIGWQDEMPEKNKKALRKLLIPIFVLIPVLVFIIVYFTKPFNTHAFELGNVMTFTGIYYSQPMPVLVLDEGQSPIKGQNHALLVGYGKNGAGTFINPMEKEKGALNGRRVKLSGTLIYGDGRVLLELTDRDNSVLEVYEMAISTEVDYYKGNKVLEGEILDPKCWFGVMKPGEGKVHKSCAIRCISGGIPPVLRVDVDGKNEYYVLANKSKLLNQDVLPFVAEPVSVQGEVEQINGWNVLWTGKEKIDYLVP